MVREVKRNEVEEEIRKQVDNLMRDELDLLKIVCILSILLSLNVKFCFWCTLKAVERDKGKKGKITKKKKKKSKASKKGKKKKEKDLTPDRTTEVSKVDITNLHVTKVLFSKKSLLCPSSDL